MTHAQQPQDMPLPLRRDRRAHQKKRRKKAARTSWWYEIAFFLVSIVIMMTLTYLFIFRTYSIPSGSMEPSINIGDTVVATRPLWDAFREGPKVQRGDVVVFSDDLDWLKDDEGDYLIKRVIGVGGDHVEGRADGTVWINGSQIDESYIADGADPSNVVFDVTVPDKELWVMGDNRNASADSRYHMSETESGTISLESVIGVAVLKVNLPTSISKVDSHHETFAKVSSK
jgi:signal peptidase I